ncbi:MAG: phosphatase PAP2 family protein [Ferruginibacter sp.]
MKTAAVISFFFIFQALQSIAQNADIDILRPINKNSSWFKDKYLELNASSVSALSIGIPAGIAIAGFVNNDPKLKKDALYMGAGYIVSAVITQSVKRIVNRKRPFEEYAFIVKRDDESGGLSFPSGHTSAAFETATSVALRYRKWYFVTPAYIFAGSVAWARMYQGVHYPSDVLAGAVVGAGSAWLSWKAQSKWFVKKNKAAASLSGTVF